MLALRLGAEGLKSGRVAEPAQGRQAHGAGTVLQAGPACPAPVPFLLRPTGSLFSCLQSSCCVSMRRSQSQAGQMSPVSQSCVTWLPLATGRLGEASIVAPEILLLKIVGVPLRCGNIGEAASDVCWRMQIEMTVKFHGSPRLAEVTACESRPV